MNRVNSNQPGREILCGTGMLMAAGMIYMKAFENYNLWLLVPSIILLSLGMFTITMPIRLEDLTTEESDGEYK